MQPTFTDSCIKGHILSELLNVTKTFNEIIKNTLC